MLGEGGDNLSKPKEVNIILGIPPNLKVGYILRSLAFSEYNFVENLISLKGLFTNYASGRKGGGSKMLTMADKGRRGVRQMLTLADKGNMGGKANADIG